MRMKLGVSIILIALTMASGDENSPSMTDAAPPDATDQPATVTWKIDIDNPEGYTTYVNGQEAAALEVTLPLADYKMRVDRIEVRHPDTNGLLDESVVSPLCLRNPNHPSVAEEYEGLVVAPNGQIFWATQVCTFPDGGIAIGDNSSFFHCLDPANNDCDGKCGFVVAHSSPEILHITCAPLGAVPLGGACTIDAARPNGYDDCVADAACIDGICRTMCLGDPSDDCNEQETCVALPGLSWDDPIGTCM